ncbi:MAG: LysR family transcriptional regulator [Myxococcota bacterium]
MKLTEDFDVFVAIVDAGSISAASRALSMPRATLSRQLRRLEERLNVQLVYRTARELVLTKAGERLYPRAKAMVLEAQNTVSLLQSFDNVPKGTLKLSSGPLDSRQLGAIIQEFLRAYPDIDVELHVTAEHVNLLDGRFDLAVRGGVIRDESLISRRLFGSELIALASPEYLSTHGAIEHTSDLAHHNCLRCFLSGIEPDLVWPLRDGGSVPVHGTFCSNDIVALLTATLGGMGIGLLPRTLVRPFVEEGRLVPVLEGVLGRDVSLSLVWVARDYLEPKVRAFIDFVSSQVDKNRWTQGPITPLFEGL